MFSLFLSPVIITQQVFNECLVNKWMHGLMAFSYLLWRPWNNEEEYKTQRTSLLIRRISWEALCFQGLFLPLIVQNFKHIGSSHLLFPLPGCYSHRYGTSSHFLYISAQMPTQPGGFPDHQCKIASPKPLKCLSVNIWHAQNDIRSIYIIMKAWL